MQRASRKSTIGFILMGLPFLVSGIVLLYHEMSIQIKDLSGILFSLLFTSVGAFMTVAGILALLGRFELQTARKIESKEELDEALRLAGVSFTESIKPLRSDERILWSGKPSKMRFLWQLFVLIPFLITMLIVFVYLFGGWSIYNSFVFFVGVCLFTLGIPIMGLMVYRDTNYLITNQRIITKNWGLGINLGSSVEFDNVQEIAMKCNIIDRMFGTGTVIIANTSFNKTKLAALKELCMIQELLKEAVASLKE